LSLKRGLVICGLLALAFASAARADAVEVVVTLKQPPLSAAFTAGNDRTLAYSSFARPQRLLADAPASRAYLDRLRIDQVAAANRIRAAIPTSDVRWHYGVVLNGFAVVVPRHRLAALGRIPGVDRVWPSVTYHADLDRTPQLIGATTVWGSNLATAGEGMKIGIIDDGIDQTHPFFAPRGLSYPPGFPKGQTAFTTPKVIVARAFAPKTPTYANATRPFDPTLSFHGLHVAGIAAGDDSTVTRTGLRLSGIAPRAYLGNYKALTMPSQFGLNGNSPELAAAVEAAVRDGMDVINLSAGETEIEPSRDIVVRAFNAAADAGVVSAVSAGNDFAEFGFGSIGSPANAAKVITAAASTGGHGSAEDDAPAGYSSAGPTPYSLRFKPDVTAPGSDVASAYPMGGYGELSGTSMAAPHVAGGAAVLKQRHPTWAPGDVKSALVLTGDPVHSGSTEVSALREGGGRIDLVRADRPLLFARPTTLSFALLRAGARRTQRIQLRDAGGGAGAWSAQLALTRVGLVSAPAQVRVPGTLTVRVAVPRGAAEGDVSGFVVLSRGSDRRRIPMWFRVERPKLLRHPRSFLGRPGTYSGNTARGVARVRSYRYPELGGAGIPTSLAGREIVFRVRIKGRPANLGVAVTRRPAGVRVEPRIVRAGDENRLAGYTALPLDLNPYRPSYGRHRLTAGVLLPASGLYDIVFDTPKGNRTGQFRFNYWIGDTTPPRARVLGVRRGALVIGVFDGGSGVDPESLEARVDGRQKPVSLSGRTARVSLVGVAPGKHSLSFTVADYQETKNTEDIPGVRPNTRRLQTAFTR
jgi:subtilisin family serine protease